MKLKEYIESEKYQNLKIEGHHEYTEIISTEFENSDLSLATFQGLDLNEVKLNKCNLANLELTSHSYQNVVFDNCNLVGINFADSYLDNVIFNNCNLLYANFSGSNLKNITFSNCILKESSFNNLKWKKITFESCDLTNSEFYNTIMRDIDFTTSTITNIKININNLKGLIVNYEQALVLSLLLGIKIK